MKIYIVNPKYDYPMYFGSDKLKDMVFVADATIVSVASLFAREGFDVEVCDENISEIDYNTDAKYIGITGKLTQLRSMEKIAKKFKALGKTIIVGGTIASESPETAMTFGDSVIVGEIEEIIGDICHDLKTDDYSPLYKGTKPDPIISPLPRWDLYPNDKAICGLVQTARGCFHHCEFCAVTDVFGNKIRYKTTQQIMEEIELLYKSGYKYIFIADDNFVAKPELLRALKGWNSNKVFFTIQSSLDMLQDDKNLRAYSQMGVSRIFIGLETPNIKGLKEVNKTQNINSNIRDIVKNCGKYDMSIMAGMILGFDADNSKIFDKHFDFAMSLPIAIYNYWDLMAPHLSLLYKRLKKDNRIDETCQFTGLPWETNIIPKQMSNKELRDNTLLLLNRLYEPVNFNTRLQASVEILNPIHSTVQLDPKLESTVYRLIKILYSLGTEERTLCRNLHKYQKHWIHIFPSLLQYTQIRYMLQGA